MYSESMELCKFRAELIDGGFDPAEAFQIIMSYFEAKLDTRQAEDGLIYLVNEQVDLGDSGDG